MSKKQPRWMHAETGAPLHGQARFPFIVRYWKRRTAQRVRRLRLAHEGRIGECQGKEYCYIVDGSDISTCFTCGNQF